MTITVILLDDNLSFRKSVADYLQIAPEIQIIGQGKDGVEALSLAEAVLPDVMVMDWVMPGMGGKDATYFLKKRFPAIRIIILTMHADEIHVQNAIQSGARGYILKEDTVEHLIPAIQTVTKGKPYFSPRIQLVIDGIFEKPISRLIPERKKTA